MHTLDIDSINTRFGIDKHLRFERGSNDFAMIEISNSLATASLTLQGAQLLTWAPTGHRPVVWLSKQAKYQQGKSVRGGVPVCWPWFGPHSSEPKYPGHGYARAACWEVCTTEALANGATSLTLRLIRTDDQGQYWPYSTPLELHIVVGTQLVMELRTRNLGATAVTIGQALHTYFGISDIRNVKVLGLDGARYLDKVDGGKEKLQSGPVTFSGETDRVYLDTDATCVIDDPGLSRRILISKAGSRSTVVWNPWIDKAAALGDMGDTGYLNMLCVESANAADDTVVIAPGDEHVLAVTYGVETLG